VSAIQTIKLTQMCGESLAGGGTDDMKHYDVISYNDVTMTPHPDTSSGETCILLMYRY